MEDHFYYCGIRDHTSNLHTTIHTRKHYTFYLIYWYHFWSICFEEFQRMYYEVYIVINICSCRDIRIKESITDPLSFERKYLYFLMDHVNRIGSGQMDSTPSRKTTRENWNYIEWKCVEKGFHESRSWLFHYLLFIINSL